MHIQVNGVQRELPAVATVADLLTSLDVGGSRRFAVEINGTVVPRSEHSSRRIAEGDRIELIGAVGGG